MRTIWAVLFFFLLPFLTFSSTISSPGGVPRPAHLPLLFEPNQGQAGSEVLFLGRGREYTILLTARETVVRPRGSEGRPIRLKWLGANPSPQSEGLEPLAGKINYFLGNDPAGWHTNIPGYARVLYRGLYPGIDVVFRNVEDRLEYDINLAAGVDPAVVQFSAEGVDRMTLDASGDLLLTSGRTTFRQPKPVVFQEIEGSRRPLEGQYILLGKRRVSFRVAGRDPRYPLTIDPLLVYSGYLGGSGEDRALGIAVDGSGKAYVAGLTYSANFPVTAGTWPNPNTGGGIDAFVAKWDTAGKTPEYITYFGGFGDDIASRVAVDSAGNVHVVGTTSSQNFPTSPDGYQKSYRGGDHDMFVFKLNSGGTLLAYSTYLGGAGDDVGRDIALDSAGKIYVTGFTNSLGYPVTQGTWQTRLAGGYDAVVTRVDPFRAQVIECSTFLGGTGDDQGTAIRVDANGLVYVAGVTASDDFPTTPGVIQPRRTGGKDSFLAKLSVGANSLVFSTYLGGSGDEEISALALDSEGNAYVTGHVQSTNFPVTPGAFQTTHGGGTDDALVAKVNSTGNRLAYATYLGGSRNDVGLDITVDAGGVAYVLGATASENFPSTPAPLDPSPLGGVDVFITALHPAGSRLVLSRVLGGTGSDEGHGIALDANLAVYLAGATSSRDYPIVVGSFRPNYGGGDWDAFVTKLRPPVFTTVSAASFKRGAASAPDSIVAGYGPEMSTATQSAPPGQPLPTSIAGTSVTVTDSFGTSRDALLFFVSPGQINYLLPPGTPNGISTVTVRNGGQVVSYGLLDVDTLSPGLFTATFDGQGAPAALVKFFRNGQMLSWGYTFRCPGGVCTPAPIDMGPATDDVYLELYGTGIRGVSSLAKVTASVGGENAIVEYAGAVPSLYGLDQVNVKVPRILKGRGLVDLVLTVDGKAVNTVQLNFQ